MESAVVDAMKNPEKDCLEYESYIFWILRQERRLQNDTSTL